MQSAHDLIKTTISEAKSVSGFPAVTEGEMPDAKLHVAFRDAAETQVAVGALMRESARRGVTISRAQVARSGDFLVLRVA